MSGINRLFLLLSIFFLLFFISPKVFAECEFPGPPPPPDLFPDQYAQWQEKQSQYEKCSQTQAPADESQDQPTENHPQKNQPQESNPQPTLIPTSEGSIINVTSTKPEVKVFTAGVDIKVGQTLQTDGNTKVYINLPDNGSLMVDTNSSFTYLPPAQKTWVEILKGNVRFTLQKAFDRTWRITTNSIAVVVRGTDFLIEKGENGETTLYVLSGKVAVSDPKGENTVEVPTGYQTTASVDLPPSPPTKFDPAKLNKWYSDIDEKLKNQNIPALAIFAVLVLVAVAISYKVLKLRKKSRKER